MKINRQKAMKLWAKEYGNKEFAYDFNGKLMYREAYGKPGFFITGINGEKIYCGWNIHHILPKAYGGTDSMDNLTCTNYATNIGAGSKITYWLDDSKYQVQRDKGKGSHKLVKLGY